MKTDSQINDIPIQYQQGFVEFYKLKFKVTQDVLIPRPETELLVDAVIEYARCNLEPITILDIGTGAGNIAISLALNLPTAKITATEVSSTALKIAKKNARFHKVADRINFLESDLLFSIKSPFQVIVTNLPYIPSERINYLDPSVKDFEPHVALDGGQNGFALYEKLFAQIREKENFPQLLLGEIDYTHGNIAKEIAEKYFPKAKVEIKFDLFHRQRILQIKFN